MDIDVLFFFFFSSRRRHTRLTTNYDLVFERTYDRAGIKKQYLAKIIRDGDNFSEKLKDKSAVPFLKLHGCISVINDSELPLILASEEYAKHRVNRERLFSHFKEWGLEHPIIFCGYEISDPNIQIIMFDLADHGINRPVYAIVNPKLSEYDIRYWSARRFIPCKMTFENFLR